MKKVNYYCDDKDCQKELSWGEQYFIVNIEVHEPNVSYSTQEKKEKHFCRECFERRY